MMKSFPRTINKLRTNPQTIKEMRPTLMKRSEISDTAGDAQWYPAQVPGTVYTDLLRNGQMEDPFWKDNEYRALDLMEKDYEYETVFEGTEAQEGERQWLRFEGLDTICDIYLNEEKIGNTYNMHRTWEFDVTGKVKAGENILRGRIH
mgnify:CR=1 FL=1